MSSNNPPIANYDTSSVSVAGPQSFTGNILANDIDPAGLPLQVASVDNIAIVNTATIIGSYGTLVVSANGNYTYTLNSAAAGVQGLAANAVLMDTFDYTVTDGQTYTTTTTQTTQNLISQSEAFNSSPWVAFKSSGTTPSVTANVAAGPNGGSSTADQVTLSSASSGLYTVTNVAGQYTFSVWVKLISGSGVFSLNYYSGSTNTSNLQTVTATSTWQRVSVTFNGDGNANSNVALMLSSSQASAGTFDFWGAQLNAGAAPNPYVATTGSPITTTATVTTPLVVASSLTVAIGENSVVPTVSPDTAVVTEDASLVTTGNVLANDTGPAGYPLSVTAVNGIAITNTTTIVGTYGTLVIAPNGAYTYTLSNNQANVRSLADGQVATDAFSYTLSNGQTYTTTTTQTVQNLLSQSEAFNSSPWVIFKSSGTTPTVTANVAAGPNGGSSTADQVTLSSAGSGLYAVTNLAGQYTFSVWVKLLSGSGVFSLNYYSGSTNTSNLQTVTATSAWQRVSVTFNGDGNSNSNVALMLSSSQTATGTFDFWGAQLNAGAAPGTYVATTGSPITTTATVATPLVLGSTLNVNVTGDVPTAAPDTAAVTEDTSLVTTGNVLANDTGPAGYPLSVTAVNGIAITNTTTIVGTYGTLVIAPNGAYTYTLSNNQANVRGLADGQVVTDAFAYTLSNGQTYTTTTTQTAQNLLSQSEAFNSSPWVAFKSSGTTPTVTANVAAGPNGGSSTADQVKFSSAGSGLYAVTNVAGQYTFSVWVKLLSGSGVFSLNYYNGSTNTSNLQTVTATSAWQRVSLTFNGDGNSNSNVALMLSSSQTATGTFDFWGAQLNAGAAPGSYVATTGSPINTTATVATPVVIGSTLTVNVTGDQVIPVAAPDTAVVTEDTTLVTTGNVLANDTGPAGYPLSVTAVNGIAITNTTTITGTYGTLVIAPNGAYTYTLANNQANVRSLANGQMATDTFAYSMSDGLPYAQTTTQLQQNLISQSEAFDSAIWNAVNPSDWLGVIVQANVAAGPNGGPSTADQINLPSPGAQLSTPTGVAGTYTFSLWVRLVSGSGDFALEYYAGNTGTATVQTAVATGQWQRFTLSFNGDGATTSYLALLHTLYEGDAGVYQIWGAQLNAGTTALPYTSTTGSPISNTTTTTATAASSILTVDVIGVTPVAAADTASVAVQGTQSASGNLLSNDTAPPGTNLSVTAVNGVAVNGSATIVGVYGTLIVQSNGQYTYTLNANAPIVRTLVGGQTADDSFTYTLSNGLTYSNTDTGVAENLIPQSEAFDNSAWVRFGSSGKPSVVANTNPGPSGGASTADQVTLSSAGSGIYYTTNVPGEYTFSVWVRLISGNGNFAFDYFQGSSGVNYVQTAVASSGWQQFSWTFLGDSNAGSNVALMHSTAQSSTGTFEFWGAQLNPGATADAYVATAGSPASATVTTTAPVTIGATLDVAVAGSDINQAGPALNLQASTQGAVANLATGQMVTPLSIMPLGDSITEGWTQQDWVVQSNLPSEPGYRGPLWQTFVNNNMLVNFVGPNSNGPASLPDKAHAGFSGDTTAELLQRMPGLLAQQLPGAVLLMAGTNDVLKNVPQATTIANLTSIINLIQAASPSTQIYLATLTPLSAASVTSMNSAITALASQTAAAGAKVTLVNMSNVSSSDLGPDGTHPTAAGYAIMAQDWYNAIIANQANQGGTPGGTPTTISPSTVNIVGGSGPEFLSGNSGNNIITAGSGYSVLSGGGGDDTLVGGAGADQFDIAALAGNTTIFNFDPAQGDFLDWKGIPGLTNAASLNAATTQSGGQTLVNLQSFGVSGQVTLASYTGSLTNSIFT